MLIPQLNNHIYKERCHVLCPVKDLLFLSVLTHVLLGIYLDKELQDHMVTLC